MNGIDNFGAGFLDDLDFPIQPFKMSETLDEVEFTGHIALEPYIPFSPPVKLQMDVFRGPSKYGETALDQMNVQLGAGAGVSMLATAEKVVQIKEEQIPAASEQPTKRQKTASGAVNKTPKKAAVEGEDEDEGSGSGAGVRAGTKRKKPSKPSRRSSAAESSDSDNNRRLTRKERNSANAFAYRQRKAQAKERAEQFEEDLLDALDNPNFIDKLLKKDRYDTDVVDPKEITKRVRIFKKIQSLQQKG